MAQVALATGDGPHIRHKRVFTHDPRHALKAQPSISPPLASVSDDTLSMACAGGRKAIARSPPLPPQAPLSLQSSHLPPSKPLASIRTWRPLALRLLSSSRPLVLSLAPFFLRGCGGGVCLVLSSLPRAIRWRRHAAVPTRRCFRGRTMRTDLALGLDVHHAVLGCCARSAVSWHASTLPSTRMAPHDFLALFRSSTPHCHGLCAFIDLAISSILSCIASPPHPFLSARA